jgi:hypothetical protein
MLALYLELFSPLVRYVTCPLVHTLVQIALSSDHLYSLI